MSRTSFTMRGDAAVVPLTKGYETVVDADMAGLVCVWNWGALISPRKAYARRRRLVSDGPGQGVILLHRFIINADAFSGFEVDHINGDSLDNRRRNLRLVSHADNIRNSKLRHDNTSGKKGVFWDKFTGRWMAAIYHNGKFHNLGRFDSADDAQAAYAEAAREFFGKFARLA